MNLSQEFLDFVNLHESDDVCTLRLKYSGKHFESDHLPLEFALVQIEARQKTKKKLPSVVAVPSFLFPSLISAEQASNEAVARFHASLVSPGSSLLDMTSGLGIDDFAFAEADVKVTSCEIDRSRCDVLTHNCKTLGLEDDIKIVCTDAVDFIKRSSDSYDVIYADPARRATDGKRVHALADCQPDILANMSDIMAHTDRFLVKCSPLLDLSLIISTVKDLAHIYVVCFRGECKEVLIEIIKDSSFMGVSAIDLDWSGVISRHDRLMATNGNNANIKYVELPSPADFQYLYEPNAAVMKTGDWTCLSEKFPDLRKADPNSHLFFSNSLHESFPGRILKIVSSPDKQSIKKLKGGKLNIVSRNHPLTAPQISKKYGIVSGGLDFLYAFRYMAQPTFLLCTPL